MRTQSARRVLFISLAAAMLGGCGAEDTRSVAEESSEVRSGLSAAEKSAPAPAPQVTWAEYVDPTHDIMVNHPARWEVRPRSEAPDQVGGTLSFVEPADASDEPAKIEIGLYLVEREAHQGLAEWAAKYDSVYSFFPPSDVDVRRSEEVSLQGRRIYRKSGASPLTPFTYANIPNGRAVWFVWMNRADPEHQAIFDRVVSSLRFGPRSPSSLQAAYGADFKPMPLEGLAPPRLSDEPRSITSSYVSPISFTAYLACGTISAPICNGTHKNAARYAIDISVSPGSGVRNAYTANVGTAGWDNTGYGYLVTMSDSANGYLAYYAHLYSINYTTLYSMHPVPTGMQIAQSGSTGNAGTPHLHFHVQTSGGSAVSLTGMTGLTLWADYPNCSKTACPSTSFQCSCGRVN